MGISQINNTSGFNGKRSTSSISDVYKIVSDKLTQVTNDQNTNTETVDFGQENTSSNIEQLNQLNDLLNESINDIENQISTLKSSASAWAGGGWDRPSATSNSNQNNDEQIKSLENDLATLKMYQSEIQRAIDLEPYNTILNSQDYQKFVESYSSDNIGINYDELTTYDMDIYAAQKGISTDEIDMYAVFEYIYNNRPEGTDIEYARAMWAGNSSVAVSDNFYFMTDDQKNMYHYLFQKEGKESAERYITLIQDDINKASGTYSASLFIDSLDMSDKGKLEESLNNYFKTSGKGFVDGIGTFFDGLNNAIINNEQLTASDYETMIILEYLQENSNYLDETYEFSSALGNMAPALTASAIVSFVGTPAAGAKTASALMGLSAYGNAKHQALVKGNDLASSTIYGLLVGTSEATLGYFLGRIPGISKYSGLTIKNLLMEGTEEYSQEWLDAGFRAIVLGEEVDFEKVPEDATKSFIMGVMMAGLTNGGQSIVNLKINGQETAINIEDTLKYIEDNPGTDIIDALAVQNPGIVDFIKVKLSTSSASSIKEAKQAISRIVQSKNNPIDQTNLVEAIQEYMTNIYTNTKDYKVLRSAARASIELLKEINFTDIAAARAIGHINQNILSNVGYDSYFDPQTGIKINIIKNMDWSKQSFDPNKVMQQIQNLPPEMQNLVQEINYYDTFNPMDFYWEITYNAHNFTSAATGGGGQINFWATSRYSQSTVAHEIAHSYDTAYAGAWGVETLKISESRIWLDAMEQDLQSSGLTGVTEYARSSESSVEDFAEAVSLYYNNPNALDQFPARKAILEQHLSKADNIAQDYDKVYDIMVNKFGQEEALDRFQRYIDTGDINLFTRDGNARDIMRKYSSQELADYYESIKTQAEQDHQQAIKASFDNAFGALIRKYGADQAARQMQKYIDTGDKQYITNSESAREQMVYSVEEYQEYLKSINNDSLDVSNLFGGEK